jgi:hypothetical protein
VDALEDGERLLSWAIEFADDRAVEFADFWLVGKVDLRIAHGCEGFEFFLLLR